MGKWIRTLLATPARGALAVVVTAVVSAGLISEPLSGLLATIAGFLAQ